jgi:acyl-CoA reductase-like NAD-dependent aldehyde dehydrogenase
MAAAAQSFVAVNPATGKPGPAHAGHSAEEPREIVALARAAFVGWKRTGFEDRAAPMRRAAALCANAPTRSRC